MTVFRSRPTLLICALVGNLAFIGQAGLALAQAPTENWPFDEHGEKPPAIPATPQPKSPVQQRLEDLYRRDGRPLPEYMQQDGASSPSEPAKPAAPAPATSGATQRNQREAAAPQGSIQQQLNGYYQSQGKTMPTAQPGQSAAPQPGQSAATQPAPGHWYDRINPFHRSQPAPPVPPQQQSEVAGSAPVNTASQTVAPSTEARQLVPPPDPQAMTAISTPAASAPVAKPTSFWGDFSLRRAPQPESQSPAPIWVELGEGRRLVRKTPPAPSSDSVAATQAPAASAPVTVSAKPAVAAPATVVPAVVSSPEASAPTEPQAPAVVTSGDHKVATVDATSSADDPAMPFRESSEAEADQQQPLQQAEPGPYSGLTLEDEQSQLIPPKQEAPKVVKKARPVQAPAAPPAPKPEAAPQAQPAEPSITPVQQPQQSKPQSAAEDHRDDPTGHVSLPSAEEQNAPIAEPAATPAPAATPVPKEASGHASYPQADRSEPADRVPHVPYSVVRTRQPQTNVEKSRLIEERVGQRGLKGFCPVVLRDQRELADVNPAYCSVYHAQRYYFSSTQAKARFDAAPQKYAPAAGGLDVVVKSNTDQAVDGSLDFALWYKDRLYLFCSPESLHAFSANPTAYAAAVARLP